MLVDKSRICRIGVLKCSCMPQQGEVDAQFVPGETGVAEKSEGFNQFLLAQRSDCLLVVCQSGLLVLLDELVIMEHQHLFLEWSFNKRKVSASHPFLHLLRPRLRHL